MNSIAIEPITATFARCSSCIIQTIDTTAGLLITSIPIVRIDITVTFAWATSATDFIRFAPKCWITRLTSITIITLLTKAFRCFACRHIHFTSRCKIIRFNRQWTCTNTTSDILRWIAMITLQTTFTIFACRMIFTGETMARFNITDFTLTIALTWHTSITMCTVRAAILFVIASSTCFT